MKVKRFNENVDRGHQNYMFFENLKIMKTYIDEMIVMDSEQVDVILTEHPWAIDHLASSKDDTQEVYEFLKASVSK